MLHINKVMNPSLLGFIYLSRWAFVRAMSIHDLPDFLYRSEYMAWHELGAQQKLND